MKKLLLAVVAVLAIAGGTAGVIVANQEAPKQATQTQTSQAQQEISYAGVAGKDALELLKQSYQVETQEYDGLGELVTSIDGVSPDSSHFWALYINGQLAQVGAGSYVTKDTDTLVWKLEAIQ